MRNTARFDTAAFDGPIERIAVFRALMLGDLLCAGPALWALRQHYPNAEITLIGLPWAATLAQRLPTIDRFLPFPGYPGLPEVTPDLKALPDFMAEVQNRRFDLLLQMHGSGAIVNPLIASFGVRNSAGFHDGHGWYPDQERGGPSPWRQWPSQGHEIQRLLTLTDHLGMARVGSSLDYPLLPGDDEALKMLWPDGRAPQRYVCLHPGAQLSSRRWLPDRFAAVGDALVDRGLTVVLTGGQPELPLVRDVQQRMRRPSILMAGLTSLWTLGALLKGAERLVSNDTGVSHVAAALGTPSVIVSCGADVERWAPLDRSRHRVLWADMACRPCDHRECPTAHECARAIEVGRVIDALFEPSAAPVAPPRRAPTALAMRGALHG